MPSPGWQQVFTGAGEELSERALLLLAAVLMSTVQWYVNIFLEYSTWLGIIPQMQMIDTVSQGPATVVCLGTTWLGNESLQWCLKRRKYVKS